jgi:hypothetical protein
MSDEIKNLNQEAMSMDADGLSTAELDDALLEEVAGGDGPIECTTFHCGTYKRH